MYDVSGASHFPGSAALLGHVVPLAVEGWSDETLTEDLALTLRLYLEVKAGREL
jgi:cellulose synthase/poly-beta-1,6-N-acetylglucosamine synthase-like glycosyltransferase